jgi:hypothetical protein
MWSTGKFVAISLSGRADIHPSISQNPAPDPSFSEAIRPFLTGSAPQTEFDVTHSKQTTEIILTGARTHIRIFEILQISAQNDDATSVGPPKSTASRAWGRGHEVARMRPSLTETAQHSEIDVTHSKQTAGEFLTETRIACRHDLNFALRRSKFGLAPFSPFEGRI